VGEWVGDSIIWHLSNSHYVSAAKKGFSTKVGRGALPPGWQTGPTHNGAPQPRDTD